MIQEQDIPEFIKAFQLAKQRVKTLGFYRAENFRKAIVVELIKAMRTVSTQPSTPNYVGRYFAKVIMTTTLQFATEQLPYEFNELRKLITSLSLFHLPTQEENRILGQLESELESAIPPLQKMEKEFDISKLNPPQYYQDIMKTQDYILNIDQRFFELQKRVEMRIQDNMIHISTKLAPMDKELFKLLMDEP